MEEQSIATFQNMYFINTTELRGNVSSKPWVPGYATGHTMATLFWTSFGFLGILMSYQHFYSSRACSKQFYAYVDIPFDFLAGKLKHLPVFGILKTTFAGTFTVMEIVAGIVLGVSANQGTIKLQHELMGFGFTISGIVDIIYSLERRRNQSEKSKGKAEYLLKDIDYMAFAAVVGLQAMAVVFHTHHRTPVDTRLHQLQGALTTCLLLALIMEAIFRSQPMLLIIRNCFIMSQGTWLGIITYYLYYPGWEYLDLDLFSNETVRTVSTIFVLQMIFNLHVVYVINFIFAWAYSKPKGYHLTLDVDLDGDASLVDGNKSEKKSPTSLPMDAVHN